MVAQIVGLSCEVGLTSRSSFVGLSGSSRTTRRGWQQQKLLSPFLEPLVDAGVIFSTAVSDVSGSQNSRAVTNLRVG